VTEEDERQLTELLNQAESMVKAAKLSLDGSRRTGSLKDTRHFAERLHMASSIYLETIDMIVEDK
jgi:hypothetical protein